MATFQQLDAVYNAYTSAFDRARKLDPTGASDDARVAEANMRSTKLARDTALSRINDGEVDNGQFPYGVLVGGITLANKLTSDLNNNNVDAVLVTSTNDAVNYSNVSTLMQNSTITTGGSGPTPFKLSPLILIGGALALYLLLRRR